LRAEAGRVMEIMLGTRNNLVTKFVTQKSQVYAK
jgi:hypothetical protein